MTLTSRRAFLGTAAAAALPLRAASKEPIKLGVASYSLRKLSRQQAIAGIRGMQVNYVSIKSFHLPYELSDAELRAGAKEFTSAGLRILSGGNIDLKDPAKLRGMFHYAKTAGIPMMVCAPSHQTLDAVEKLAKEFDIKIAIHNHGPEDKHFPSPQSVLDAVKGRDPRMGLCIDLGHSTRTGADVVKAIADAGPRLLDVHIKDLRDLMEKGSQCAVGEGKMPVKEIFAQLIKMKYTGAVMLEYEINADNPLPGMTQSFEHMRKVLGQLKS